MEHKKFVKVLTVEPANRGILETGKIYEVLRFKRDEVLLKTGEDSLPVYAWKDHVELIKE